MLKYLEGPKHGMRLLWRCDRTFREMLVFNYRVIRFVLGSFIESNCNFGDSELEFFQRQMVGRLFTLELLYRGSRDGWFAEDFHRRCDDRGPTLSLFKIKVPRGFKKPGDCIGGFTT